MNRFSKALVICGALLIWYALVGFLIAPALIRHFGEKQLQQRFSSDSVITQVRINPFNGSLRVTGLKVSDKLGAWSMAWQEAELNVSAATFINFYPVVDVVRLVGADLSYAKKAKRETGPAPEPAPQAPDDWRDFVDQLNLKKVPELRVDLFEVEAGRIEFVDETASALYSKVIDPINFTLRDLTTVVDSDSAMRFVAETDDGAIFSWEGDFRSHPIRSLGTLSLSGLAVHDLSPYYSQFIRFQLKRAVFGLGFDYELDLSNLDELFQIKNGHLALTEVLCQPLDERDQLITVDSVALQGIDFRFPEMALNVADVVISSGETRIFRDATGQINLAQLLALPTAPMPSEQVPSPAAAASESSIPELRYQIDTIKLKDYSIVWEEVLDAGNANLTVQIPRMHFSNVSSDLEAPVQVLADYRIGESGQAHIEGSMVPAEPAIDLTMKIEELPLSLLSPYTSNFGQTQIEQGTFAFDGRFQYANTGKQMLTGNASVQDIDFVYDGNLNAKWQALDMDGLQFELSPFALSVETLGLDRPEIVFSKSAPAASEELSADPAAAASDEAANDTQQTPIRIDHLSISKGAITFVDRSVVTEPKIVMDDFGVVLRNLDLSSNQPAELELNTNINGSTLAIDGQVNVSQVKETTNFKASLRGLSLPAFSAYSGQAIGRRIASGQFNLDSDWQIEASQLKASNKIRIEQLEFGDRVESEQAISLPLDLAVTLLKGPSGVMDLSLPLSGDLSDPKVGIGQIVRTAIVGLITNVATAPFKLLSGLAGGSEEDLSQVSFDSGSAQLTPEMLARLNSLATALKERPGLNLMLVSQLSQEDERTLSETQLRADIMGDSAADNEKLFRQALTKRYRQSMQQADAPDQETQSDTEAGVQQMVTALLPEFELTTADRANLATARARGVQEHLVTAQGIASERLTISDPEFEASESAVKFDLK